MLSARQIEVIQSTFSQVKPMADAAATLFYDRLFALDPSLRHLFRGANMSEQRRKLMTMLGVVVAGLPRLQSLLGAVEDMGRRHARYGVEDSHYETVGTALLWTLERSLGPSFTPEVREAWTATYAMLANTMKRAAAEVIAA